MGEGFQFTMSPWEIAVRTSLVYLVLVVLLRIIPKRHAGNISPNDMLALILIGAIAADGVMGGTHSIANVLLMIAIVIAWGYAFDLLEYHIPWARRLLRDRQTPLVRDGRLLRKNLEREKVTEEELMAVLRKQGVSDLDLVHSACLEADGHISVIRTDDGSTRPAGP